MLQAWFAKIGLQAILYIVGGLLVTGVIGIGYYSWKHSIQQEAVNELTIKQLKQAQAEIDAQQKLLEDLKLQAAQVRWELQQATAKVDKVQADLEAQIDAAPGDRPASDVIKNVVKQLGGQK